MTLLSMVLHLLMQAMAASTYVVTKTCVHSCILSRLVLHSLLHLVLCCNIASLKSDFHLHTVATSASSYCSKNYAGMRQYLCTLAPCHHQELMLPMSSSHISATPSLPLQPSLPCPANQARMRLPKHTLNCASLSHPRHQQDGGCTIVILSRLLAGSSLPLPIYSQPATHS